MDGRACYDVLRARHRDEEKVIMKTFFITLTGCLSGYCLVAIAVSENQVRQFCVGNLGKIWCSVCENEPPEQVIGNIIRL
jgi:hypothetical protein